jgi:hypothetical protein
MSTPGIDAGHTQEPRNVLYFSRDGTVLLAELASEDFGL